MINNSSIENQFGKTIFMTGANSGIGFYSVIKFLETKNYLYIPLRSKKRKDLFINNLKNFYSESHLKKYLKIINDVDLANLENVSNLKQFFENANIKFDIFILNAGLQYTGALYPKVSKQGIELTFAVNHLSHFYIINLLNSPMISSLKLFKLFKPAFSPILPPELFGLCTSEDVIIILDSDESLIIEFNRLII